MLHILYYAVLHAAVPLQHCRLHAARPLVQCPSVKPHCASFGASSRLHGPAVQYSEHFE